MDEIKQVIVVRTNYEKNGKPFKMRRGKELAQVCHASLKFISDKLRKGDYYPSALFSLPEYNWLVGQEFKKIVLKVETEKELLSLYEMAKDAGLVSCLIQDSAKTEFEKPEYTALSIGPDYSDKIDPITKNLKLY